MLVRIEGVLTKEELARISARLAAARFIEGGATAGREAARVKENLQLDPASADAQELGALVSTALARSGAFGMSAFPRRMSKPMFSRYLPGMVYGRHLDNAVMYHPEPVRSDLALTLFLNDPGSYEGGELMIHDGILGQQKVKLAAGSAILYPAWSIHEVGRVTAGQRDAAVLWVQSMVRSVEQRRILFEMAMALQALRARHPDAPELTVLSAAHQNLLRLWAEA
jgi:PKHD-type hydroxylase